MNRFLFQVRKCNQDGCAYCLFHPPRIPPDLFEELFFLPDPVLGSDSKFLGFCDVYGTPTTDKDRPGLKFTGVATDRDKKFKSLLVGSKSILISADSSAVHRMLKVLFVWLVQYQRNV